MAAVISFCALYVSWLAGPNVGGQPAGVVQQARLISCVPAAAKSALRLRLKLDVKSEQGVSLRSFGLVPA